MSARRRAIARSLVLPLVGAGLMIWGAYQSPTFNGLDLLGWAVFVLGMIRLGRNPGWLFRRRGGRR